MEADFIPRDGETPAYRAQAGHMSETINTTSPVTVVLVHGALLIPPTGPV
jgi:hypothetical protein